MFYLVLVDRGGSTGRQRIGEQFCRVFEEDLYRFRASVRWEVDIGNPRFIEEQRARRVRGQDQRKTWYLGKS